jgi:hypothetical protein
MHLFILVSLGQVQILASGGSVTDLFPDLTGSIPPPVVHCTFVFLVAGYGRIIEVKARLAEVATWVTLEVVL